MSALWNGLLDLLGAVLAFFYGMVPNIGFAIIMLTLLVNVVVFPLTLRQTRSTRAMQEIQPEVERLRKQHKDNPQELNQEIMALYKERGVNPAGCFLPMVVQMPIWFALFRVLREPELYLPISSRLASDLAANDHLRFLGMDVKLSPSEAFSTLSFGGALPYLLLLAVVVGTGFLQQKLTTPRNSPANANPQAQTAQKITKILPIFFGVISFVWPAGLNLYFATSNLFRTGQQLLIFQIDGRPEPPSAVSDPVEDSAPEPTAPKKPQGSAKKRNRRRRR